MENLKKASLAQQKITEVEELGNIIRTNRKSMKLTQVVMAGICGVGVRFLSDLENGKPTVEFYKVVQVLNGLGLEIFVKQRGW